MCAYRYENESHAHLIQFETWWSSLYIGSKKESMPKKLHEVNMHAQDFQEPIPNEKEKQVKKRYQMNNSSLGGYP